MIRHSRGRILFYTAGSRHGLEGVAGHGSKKLTLRKKCVFVIEEYIEDVKQEENDVSNLVESIIRPTDPVKEELRRILMQMSPFRSKIEEFKVCIFQMTGKIPDSRRRLPAGAE